MAKRIKCHCCGTVRIVSKTSIYIGVDFHKKSNQWRARATNSVGEQIHLGCYKTELEASYAYDKYISDNQILNRPINHTNKSTTFIVKTNG